MSGETSSETSSGMGGVELAALGLTYASWVETGGPDLLLTLGQGDGAAEEQGDGAPLRLLLTCYPERYAAATAAAEQEREERQQGTQQAQQPGSDLAPLLCPVPVSPLEYETLRDALLRASVEEQIAGGTLPPGIRPSLYGPTTGDVDAQGQPLGIGAHARALRGVLAALRVKQLLGGRLEGLASLQAWDSRAQGETWGRIEAEEREAQRVAQQTAGGRQQGRVGQQQSSLRYPDPQKKSTPRRSAPIPQRTPAPQEPR